MTNPTVDALAFICDHYPRPEELTRERLVQLLYLADWVSAFNFNQAISTVDWRRSPRGLDPRDVQRALNHQEIFRWVEQWTPDRGLVAKHHVATRRACSYESLWEEELEVLDAVCRHAAALSPLGYVQWLHDSYPLAQTAGTAARLPLKRFACSMRALRPRTSSELVLAI